MKATSVLALLCSLIVITNVYATGVNYNGGPLLTVPTVCTIFYGEVDPSITSSFGNFIIGLQGSGWLEGLYEYSTANGGVFGGNINLGTYVSVSQTTPIVITDAMIQQDIANFIAQGLFPDNPNNFYYVLMGAGVNITDGPYTLCGTNGYGFCAYHSSFEIEINNNPNNIQFVHYGVGLGSTGPCDHVCGTGTVAARATGVFSHELAEAMTDPYGSGWHDASGNEIGDLCDLQFAAVELSTGPFWVQYYWSNTQQACIAPGIWYSGYLYSPFKLYGGDRLYSPSHEYYLTVQNDGNIVGYISSNNEPFWYTGTNGQIGEPFVLYIQGDGNLVAYHYPNGPTNPEVPMWYTGTSGNYGTFYLSMQDDRNIVLYQYGGSALWSSDFGKV